MKMNRWTRRILNAGKTEVVSSKDLEKVIADHVVAETFVENCKNLEKDKKYQRLINSAIEFRNE